MHSQPTPPAGGTLLSPPSPAIRERPARGPLTACKQRYLSRPNGPGDAYCKNHPSDASPDLDRPPHATDFRQLTAPRLKTPHTRTRCVTRHDAAPPAASGPTSPSERGAPAVLAGRPHNPMPNPNAVHFGCGADFSLRRASAQPVTWGQGSGARDRAGSHRLAAGGQGPGKERRFAPGFFRLWAAPTTRAGKRRLCRGTISDNQIR